MAGDRIHLTVEAPDGNGLTLESYVYDDPMIAAIYRAFRDGAVAAGYTARLVMKREVMEEIRVEKDEEL